MGEKWPSLGAAELERIVRKFCGEPIRQAGSHRRFEGRKRKFTFTYHDGDEVAGYNVRRVLIDHIGLTLKEARKEVN